MASIVDVDNAPGDQEGLIKSLTEAVTESAEKDDVQETEASNTIEQPKEVNTDPLAGTKFEGKSVEDILESYNNLQSAYGRMANDLGTQRKLTDQLLDLKRDGDLEENTPHSVQLRTEDLLDEPTTALDSYISEREARIRQEYDQKLSQFETQLRADKFMAKHPDFQELAQSEELIQWSQATPVRARVAQAAANGDWDAADALLTEFKAQPKQDPAPRADEGIEAARQVGLESAASSGDGNSAKTYRRADLIDLKLNKPHIYQDPAFQAEILKAYSEGRVK